MNALARSRRLLCDARVRELAFRKRARAGWSVGNQNLGRRPNARHPGPDGRLVATAWPAWTAFLSRKTFLSSHPVTPLAVMDFSQFNPSEQAHLSRVIERKQVRVSLRPVLPNTLTPAHAPDARLYAHVLEPRRALLHLLLQRLYQQGPLHQRGPSDSSFTFPSRSHPHSPHASPTAPTSSSSTRSAWAPALLSRTPVRHSTSLLRRAVLTLRPRLSEMMNSSQSK
jgi:hypothetical protein